MPSMLTAILAALACAGCAVCERRFLNASRAEDYRAAFFFKGAAGLCFVAVGVIAAIGCRSGAFAWRVVAGLLFGLLGDQLLAMRFIQKERHDMFFALGGVAFALGHVLYIAALVQLRSFSLRVTVPVLLVGLAASAGYARVRESNAGRLQIPGVLYIALVILTSAFACGAAAHLPNAGTGMFALGTICFVVSDNILCSYCFGNKKNFAMNEALHVSYYAAQLLIALSMAFI